MIAPKASALPDAPSLEGLESQHRIRHLNDTAQPVKQFQAFASILGIAAMAIATTTFVGLAYFERAQQDTGTFLSSESGRVAEYEGDVEISYNNGIQWQALKDYPHLHPGIHLRTQLDSSLRLSLGDTSSLELDERSQIGINSLTNIKITTQHIQGVITASISESEEWTFEILNQAEKSVIGEGDFSARYNNGEWQLNVTSGWLRHAGSQTNHSLRVKEDN